KIKEINKMEQKNNSDNKMEQKNNSDNKNAKSNDFITFFEQLIRGDKTIKEPARQKIEFLYIYNYNKLKAGYKKNKCLFIILLNIITVSSIITAALLTIEKIVDMPSAQNITLTRIEQTFMGNESNVGLDILINAEIGDGLNAIFWITLLLTIMT